MEAMMARGAFDMSGFVRQTVKLMVEEALEAEVGDQLVRDYYARGEVRSTAHRNGVRTADSPSTSRSSPRTAPRSSA